MHRDDLATKMGMWIFLFTELLLFGGLFLVYSIYRFKNPDTFSHAGQELDVFIGTINTIALITSSLTVALSITAMQKNNPKLAIRLLWTTIFLAGVFMVNKYFEWSHKIDHGLFPGQEHYMSLEAGEKLFFYLYYFMTGLHGLHVVVGSVLLIWVITQIKKGKITHDNFVYHENGGLYWHLVDLIWIYLFPLFYLVH